MSTDTDPNTDDTTNGTGTDDQGDATTDTGDATDWKAEAEKWKAAARKHEERAKANAKATQELEKLKAAQMSEAERAVAEAEQRGRQAAMADVAHKLAAAEIRAALTGIVPDPGQIVEDLNLAKYVTDTGDVDSDAVASLRSKFEGLAGSTKPGAASGGRGDGGPRGSSTQPSQLTQADLERMFREGRYEDIDKARAEGRFNQLQGIT